MTDPTPTPALQSNAKPASKSRTIRVNFLGALVLLVLAIMGAYEKAQVQVSPDVPADVQVEVQAGPPAVYAQGDETAAPSSNVRWVTIQAPLPTSHCLFVLVSFLMVPINFVLRSITSTPIKWPTVTM